MEEVEPRCCSLKTSFDEKYLVPTTKRGIDALENWMLVIVTVPRNDCPM
jgi:hypothetical protein